VQAVRSAKPAKDLLPARFRISASSRRISNMKIKLLMLATILVGTLGLAGCYDVYPGGYGGDPPMYAGGYYPAGGWGGWGPAYYGGDYHGWDWNHGGWDHDHFVVPEHGGFVAHNVGAPMGGRGYDVAHNEGFRGGYRGSSVSRAGGGSHVAARGASHSGGSRASDRR
jgi:hypothetical protein